MDPENRKLGEDLSLDSVITSENTSKSSNGGVINEETCDSVVVVESSSNSVDGVMLETVIDLNSDRISSFNGGGDGGCGSKNDKVGSSEAPSASIREIVVEEIAKFRSEGFQHVGGFQSDHDCMNEQDHGDKDTEDLFYKNWNMEYNGDRSGKNGNTQPRPSYTVP
ncbi:hypothetical protein Ddye_019622 [Dipteronia dyeriana]|uniref:Uncharacterized protein n=1 Tax=Dipteronia dyeriana TaxID=168575 RepID=A0AAD9TYP8_9ROSI|nr:hypothetical protein Ddye_019622 [Dipteronia dyeriana]